MMAVPKGTIVTFHAVNNFNQLTQDEATNIIYDQLIPALEAKGVLLSEYGNHRGRGTLVNVEEYNQKKAAHTLFNVERIQRAFASIPIIVQNVSQYKTGSYGLKHRVEEHSSQKANGQIGYITNGDTIVAMLLHGYEARFGKKNDDMAVNCEFKVKC